MHANEPLIPSRLSNIPQLQLPLPEKPLSAMQETAPSTSPLSVSSSSSFIPDDPTQRVQAMACWQAFCMNVQGEIQYSPPSGSRYQLDNRNTLSEAIASRLLQETIGSIKLLEEMHILATSDVFEKESFQRKFPQFFGKDEIKLYHSVKVQARALCSDQPQIQALDGLVARSLYESTHEKKVTAFFFSEVHYFVFTKFYADEDAISNNLFEPLSKLILQNIALSSFDETIHIQKLSVTHFSTMDIIAKNIRYREKMLQLIAGIKSLEPEKQNQLMKMPLSEQLRTQIDQKVIQAWPQPVQELYIFLHSIENQEMRSGFLARIIKALSA